jgi:hypothetical protein
MRLGVKEDDLTVDRLVIALEESRYGINITNHIFSPWMFYEQATYRARFQSINPCIASLLPFARDISVREPLPRRLDV